jgi:5'-methylthioadenosine phosphorylase
MAEPVGIIGGSGLYALLAGAEEVNVSTPFGDPSDALHVAEVSGRGVVFLPRHGRSHRLPAHRVPYLANLWAMRSLGVRQIIAPCAVGGLDQRLVPGDLVIPDQIIDRTSGRQSTLYDEGAVHVPFADPYCPRGRAAMFDAATAAGWSVQGAGTMVVINGPRFASRAESRWHAEIGGTIVNMTGMPEAVIARELALCYTAVALVTDLDAGVAEGEQVTQAKVFAMFEQRIEALRKLLFDVVATLSEDRACPCPQALEGTAAADRWK